MKDRSPIRSRRGRAAVAICLAGLALAGCGDESAQEGTPGFRADGGQVDDSPFRLAGPTTTEGPTTIPGDPSTRGSGRTPLRPPSSRPEPTVVETTTTTTVPTRPIAPDQSGIENLCGATASIASFGTIMTNPSIDVRTTTSALIRNLDRYVEVSPAELAEQMAYIRSVIQQIVETIRRNDYDVARPEVRQAVDDAANARPPFNNLIAATSELNAYELRTCR